MRAVIDKDVGGPAIVVHDRARPSLRTNGYMIVRPVAVALNPADVAVLDFHMVQAGNLLGCDYAGVVEEVGPGVLRDFKKGDRVCGPARPGGPLEPENGTFAEVICVKADLALRIPEGMGFEDASTLGVTHITTGRCLVSLPACVCGNFASVIPLTVQLQYQKLNLPLPDKPNASPGQMLVYGGSSAMGTMVIQFAKLSGYEVITTCSPQNFGLCKSFGADHVFDYNEPDTSEQIRALSKESLKLCVDCISTDSTAAFCSQVLSPGAKYSGILLAKCPRDDVESVLTVGYSFLGEPWEQFGVINPASKEDFEFSKSFAELSERFLREGKIKPHPVSIREGGLDAIPVVLEELRAKKVSGAKIVVRV